MSTDNRPILLNRYFFPIQSVHARINFDKKGKKDGSHTNLNRIIEKPKDGSNNFVLQMDLELDKEKSENPSYEFHLSVVGIFSLNIEVANEEKGKEVVQTYGSQILIGVLREKLASLTACGPWGPFYINFIPLPEFDYPLGIKSQEKILVKHQRKGDVKISPSKVKKVAKKKILLKKRVRRASEK